MGKLNYTASQINALLAKADAMEEGGSGGTTTVNVASTGLKFGYSTFSAIPTWANFTGITDGSYMFYRCSSLTSAQGVDLSSLENGSSMFYYCSSLTTIPEIESPDLTDMSYMFYYCSALTGVTFSSNPAVLNLSYAFYHCSNLTTVPEMDVSGVSNLSYAFYYCSKLTTIGYLEVWSATNLSNTFKYCNKLATMELDSLGATSSITSTIDFSSCPWVTGLYDSLYTNSYDRATAGYSTVTIKLSSTSYNSLTDAQKSAITAKGYTLTT